MPTAASIVRPQVKSYATLTEAIHEVESKAYAERPLHGVVVCSPTYTHASIIKEAADHKLSVFTEKPVDETAEKIESLFQYAKSSGIALCCGFQRRFDASYVAAVQVIRTGEIGIPVVANAFFGDHPTVHKDFLLRGGNIFMDLLCHDADFIAHALNDDVSTRRQYNVRDVFSRSEQSFRRFS